ncbi:MAG: dihydropteroate synthase [Thalassotalea sp.]|nr:dihydropteroate synthase [Thalassotalea sp.]
MNQLKCGDKVLSLATPQVMGILNVTPDSFSDGGKFKQFDSALIQVEQMLKDGATIIDIGGESTRPGAAEVSVDEELSRVIPVIDTIKARFDAVISVDTSKSEVMSAAASAGAGMINDVRALQNDGCLDVMTTNDLPICLMHMQGMPRTMQANPQYDNVTSDIIDFIAERIRVCTEKGIEKHRLLVDPGFGFGKTLMQNYQLLNQLSAFKDLELPILVGISRKSMIGNLLDADVENRLAGSLAAALYSVQQGAKIIRVHDVKETVDALSVLAAAEQPELARGK